MKMYEIADEFERVLAQEVDQDTGEITVHTYEKLEEIEADWKEKAKNVGLYAKGERLEAAKIQIEIDRLTKLRVAHTNREDRLLNYIEAYGPKDVDIRDPQVTLYYKINPPKVVPTMGTENLEAVFKTIDPVYIRAKTELSIDKVKAAPVLKAGGKIAGLKLIREKKLVLK